MREVWKNKHLPEELLTMVFWCVQCSVWQVVFRPAIVVDVAQLARALDCDSRGRGFKSRLPPFFILPNSVHSPIKDVYLS